ncbi:MAG: hypothetical protein AMK73_01525 [Planctomycetes bacterium SM23_32]|nr:MAG: hypothetical protein AMK73_01525 [Planctomycetes bacterium SM23_32]
MPLSPVIGALILTAAVVAGMASVDARDGAEAVQPGWERSYEAGYTDSRGHYAGGSEVLHLVGHKGKLYAGVSYWFDPRNIWYGGKDASTGWGQILRLDDPHGQWEVDLEMGPQHLRPEIVKSVTITTDGKGNPLKEPADLLMVSTYTPKPTAVDINVFIRDDETGDWDRATLLTGPRPRNLEDRSVRDIHVHRDRATGVDRIFISIGTLGLFSGVYDPAAPEKIRWGTKSESGPVGTRPLAIIEANGSLLFSAGSRIYRRNDGESPTYAVVYDAAETPSDSVRSPVGGIRGMSAIPNPSGRGESILFAWAPGNRSRGCIYRLDPNGRGGYTRTEEVCLDSLMTDYLDGNPVYFVLAGYNDMLPAVDPSTGETVHLIGFESWIGGHRFHTAQRKENGGFYAGGMYAVRDSDEDYRLNEVNGPSTPGKPPLVATRAYALSPFEGEENRFIYFGGNDCNEAFHSPNWAWIFRTSLANALRKDASRPRRLGTEKTKAMIRGMGEPDPE